MSVETIEASVETVNLTIKTEVRWEFFYVHGSEFIYYDSVVKRDDKYYRGDQVHLNCVDESDAIKHMIDYVELGHPGTQIKIVHFTL